MMLGRTVMVLLAAGAAGASTAQTTGTLHLQVEPAGYEYVVDHKFRMARPQLELGTGTHHFSFWAPQHSVVDTSVTVEEGRVKSIVLRLPYAKDYLVHQRELQQFQNRRKVARIIPSVATGGALLFTVLSYGKMKKAHDRLEEDRTEYGQLTSAYRIALLKEETIPAHQDAFRKARAQVAVAAGATVLCAGATAYLFYRSGREKAPVFIDKEKLRFDGLGYEPGLHGGTWTGGLTWNFSR